VDLELRNSGEVFSAMLHRSLQHQLVGAGNGTQSTVRQTGNPWNDLAVTEPDPQLHSHRNRSLDASYNPKYIACSAATLHAVNQRDSAVRRFEICFENESAFAITALYTNVIRLWRNQPSSISGVAQQCGETGRRIEAGESEPIDTAVRAHERGGCAIPDNCVTLNRQRQ
jgi:hypothetical protein